MAALIDDDLTGTNLNATDLTDINLRCANFENYMYDDKNGVCRTTWTEGKDINPNVQHIGEVGSAGMATSIIMPTSLP